jgi:hypothetical protein
MDINAIDFACSVFLKKAEDNIYNNWRDLLGYAEVFEFEHPKLAPVLDSLQELLPIKNLGDRYSDMSTWLEDAKSSGLIDRKEHNMLREAIGPNL